MTDKEKEEIIKEHIIQEGEYFTCKDWDRFYFIQKPRFDNWFHGALALIHQLRITPREKWIK